MSARDLDLVLFGATGFVGRLVAAHVAESAPSGLRIGLAGRSPERLEHVRAQLPPVAAAWPLVVADSDDDASLRALAARTAVVASTVGPYLRYGAGLVDACADAGTHYADLTGEVLFVRDIVERSHDRAQASGARIVVSCGFDSVPSDLAVHLLHERAAADGAGALTDTTLRVRRLSGGISGGTIDSLRAQLERVREEPALAAVLDDPAALAVGVDGAGATAPARIAPGQRDVSRPFLDVETGEWAAPFVMAGYNTRLVRRSTALRGGAYGERFRYREVVATGPGVRGRLAAAAVAAGTRALTVAMALPSVRRALDAVLPSPGEGPSEERRAAGSFEVETTTRTERGARYAALVAADGDPGYAATSIMLGEAALALAVDDERCSAEGGVLTPAFAMGDVLVERLRAAGLRLEVRRI
ncbi:saccharopine dehydrogenase family protein [Agrococcus sp. Marseille-P2731]|uniref:saccharopine dehydrogenase family protein n=1 Tax=Agrococcus sp. Marseille-P2731 TaxID=1841862 RepID=UPI00116054A7|nr:saccharopine dehydrogenase NADP-binding domain-containing protein [Agrococcus sp. Marseille-P2731]